MKKLPPISKRFKPGESGNPSGRPKAIPAIDAVLLDVLGDGDKMKKIIQAIARRALRGDLKAGEFLIERVYGKLKMLQEHTGSVDIFGLGLTPDEHKEFVQKFKEWKRHGKGTTE